VRNPITRRNFVRTLSSASACLAISPALAIEPIVRTGKPNFKFSLAAYSYRDLLTGKSPKMTLEGFLDDCAKFELDAAEPTAYYFPPKPTREYLTQLKQRAFRLGLDISGTAVGNDFCHPPGNERDKQIAQLKTWIEHAETLGAPVIRIFSGNAKQGQSENEARRLAVDAIHECCEFAGRHGVFLALENHGGLTETADGMLELVKSIKSPWFGVNLDTGNFRSADVYGDLAKLAPYALNVQVKASIHPAGGKKEPSDYARLAKMLTDVAYRGYIVLEFEDPGDPRVECPKQIARLREAFGRSS
jgi:sugar phosphate isomerase/epimerase